MLWSSMEKPEVEIHPNTYYVFLLLGMCASPLQDLARPFSAQYRFGGFQRYEEPPLSITPSLGIVTSKE